MTTNSNLSFDPPGKLTKPEPTKENRPMGLMSRIFGGKLAVSNEAGGNISGHNIDKNSALAPTGKGVPSPHNADFSSIRSAPVVEKPVYFNARQATALAALAGLEQSSSPNKP